MARCPCSDRVTSSSCALQRSRMVNGRPPRARGGRIILAHGNATGHNHAIAEDTATLFRPVQPTGEAWRDDAVLVVKREVTLTHEEHAPIPLGEGIYVVRRQREYRPEAIQTVID